MTDSSIPTARNRGHIRASTNPGALQQSKTETRRPRLVPNQPPIRLHQKPRPDKLIKINVLFQRENVEPATDETIGDTDEPLLCRHSRLREYRA